MKMRFWRRTPRVAFYGIVIVGLGAVNLFSVQTAPRQVPSPAASPVASPTPRAVLDKYCITCHSEKLHTAGVVLETADAAHPATKPELWERVIGKLRAGSMPPPGSPRPDPATYIAVATALENEIDRAWAANPNPGKVGAVHRLNRTEYNNAIHDLFALDLDVRPLLPGDETADGSFDNFADSLSISTAHLERYLSVARQVTRLATGLPPAVPKVDRFEIPLHVLQNERQDEDLPLGSRGGIAVHYDFPVSGEYLIKVRLQRQYQDYLKGMGWPQQLDVRLDGKLLKRFIVGGGAQGRPAAASYAGDGEPGFAGDPEWEKYMQLTGDAGLELRIPIEAGPRVVGVSFVRELFEPEGLPQPLQRGRVITNDQVYMDYANVGVVQIGGPYSPTGIAKDTPSRRAMYVCQPVGVSDEKACATKILSRMARLAYRRPVTTTDVQTLVDFFNNGRKDGGSFDAGIQFALERLLVDPDFLLRVHRDPPNSAAVGRLSDIEIASRLSFFLWSSIPDERLIDLAEHGQLSKPAILERETRRMLADPRAESAFVEGFAGQWLNLRRVDEVVVDPDRYPNYDLSLLQSFQRETELFVGSTLREDRSVDELLTANYTFVNERLAQQYGIPGIYGNRFRRVELPDLTRRGGLLAQGALLATTSYPDRTS
ncbi:MAG TPA: DUF1592 domain-containing protein, partial [Terriglobia bacterium]|nr:DUF1592 domain-containing protein [Terriglobia bacterium]